MKELQVITIRDGEWEEDRGKVIRMPGYKEEEQQENNMTEWIRERAAAMEEASAIMWERIWLTLASIGVFIAFLVMAWRLGG